MKIDCTSFVHEYEIGFCDECFYNHIRNMRTIKKHMNDRKPFTNYDRLISKTPKEMAKWLGDKDTCPPGSCQHMYDDVDCAECWLAWLKQEASE